MHTRINKKKVAAYGLLSWLVPFIASFLFFGKSGQPMLSIGLIKSAMILIGASLGGFLLFRLFKESPPSFGSGIAIGSLWFLMNILLDLSILVPMTKMNLGEYFSEIGLRYLLIPIMAGAMGAVGSQQRQE
ncbi:MAG: hypothetical protein WCB11_18495 [Terriglobales bacterium]